MTVDKHQLEAKIRSAFGCNAALDHPMPFAFPEMNQKICRFAISDAKKYLPLLMIKEMDADREFLSTGDQLVYFLDGYLRASKAEASSGGDFSSVLRQVEFQENYFKDFTRAESEAILEWLREIAYPTYKDLCAKDIESAISFWQDKIAEA